MVRPFRFAAQLSGARDIRQWRQRCRDVEAMGYSTLYVPDHCGGQWGPLVALTAAADSTQRLNVGALVFANDFRHPVVLAREAATLDLVAEGRFELGLGAGWLRSDYEQCGLPYDPPGTRIERMAEAVGIMKDLWAHGASTFEGRHYRVRAEDLPRPHTTPHPRLCIGGGGRRILTLAATEADIVGVNANLAAGAVGPAVAITATAARFDERRQWIELAAGARLDQLELQCYPSDVGIVANRRAELERVGQQVGLSAGEAAECPLILVGTTAGELCEQLRERRERWGLSYWVVDADAFEVFAPVVERLSGS